MLAGMDVLTDAIAAMRVGRAHSKRHVLTAPWGMQFENNYGAAFHVVLQGSCWLLPPGDDSPIRLGLGDVVFLHNAGAHGLADDPNSPRTALDLHDQNDGIPTETTSSTVLLCGAYLLDVSRSHPLLSEVPPMVHLPARLGSHDSLHAAVDMLGDELSQPRPGTTGVVSALIDTLLLYVLRTWFEQQGANPGADGWALAFQDDAIMSALTAMHHAPEREWSIADLGAGAGLSRAAFARRFSAAVGTPPMSYLTWWRMTLAARLLRESDKPHSAIARQVGYGSDIAFATAFKREYGVTPGAYRRTSTPT